MSRYSFLALAALLAAGVFGYAIGHNADLVLVLSASNHSVTIKTEGRRVSYDAVLDTLLGNPSVRLGARDLLATKFGLFAISDVRLVDALRDRSCRGIPRYPPMAKMKAEHECAEFPTNAGLRSLARAQRPPFHVVGEMRRATVPDETDDYGVSPGAARLCNDQWQGKSATLINPDNERQVSVILQPGLACAQVRPGGTQMHISRRDAETLFGTRRAAILTVVVQLR